MVQAMLPSEFSFVLHTVHPLNRNPREAYAEIAVGLGETLASGAARGTPYRLLCDKDGGAVRTLAFANFSQALRLSASGGTNQEVVDYSRVVLSLDESARKDLGRRLARIALALETALGVAQDVEGALVRDEVFLVQARPQVGLDAP
jgi:phosphoglucan,water dikinase